jgi:predicted lipoprotein with Yx(FWY)xxD motif
MFEGNGKRRAAPYCPLRNPLGCPDETRQRSFRLRGMRRFVHRETRLSILIVLAGLSIAIAACGSSPQSSSTSNPTGTKPVHIDAKYLSQAKATVLVNASGYALYMFVPDKQRSVTCNVTCIASWPPVTITPGNRPEAGSGIKKSLLGTVPLSSNYRVVTYNRWPLYTYQDDVSPGMVTGQGIDNDGGFWYLMSPDGTPLVPAGDPNP